jgi:S-layer homology domain.
MRRNFLVLLLIISLIVFNLPSVTRASASIDETLIEVFFNQFNKLDADTRDIALDLLRTVYFVDEEGLEQFKDDINSLLPEEYKDELRDKGISMSDVYDMIDELKSWSKDDRMKLISYVEDGDEKAVIRLLEKYEMLSSGEGTGGSSGGAASPSGQTSTPAATPAVSTPAVQVGFKDMENHWAKDVVSFLAGMGIVKGKSQDKFDPDGYITRAEFTALLVRVMGLENTSANGNIFDDVKPEDWFYSAVYAAYQKGLVKGITEHSFEPNKNITREEMAVLIARAAASMNKAIQVDSVEIENIMSQYRDSGRIHDWAQTGVASAIKSGLMSGQGNGIFNPEGKATRAESATVIYNLYQTIK